MSHAASTSTGQVYGVARVWRAWGIPRSTVDARMWGIDITATLTRHEGAANVVVLVDHCTSECLGLHAPVRATRFEATEPLRQATPGSFGAYLQGCATGLKLRHDHGSQFMSEHVQAELRFLGIESSPAFVRQPEGNGCAERFIRTLKELLWIETLDTLAELQAALGAFRQRYDTGWLVEKHAFKTPAATRQALMPAYPEAA